MDAHDRQALVYADCLKEEYPEHRFDSPRLPPLAEIVSTIVDGCYYACPNCAEVIRLEFQVHKDEQLYYVRFRCKACRFGNAGFFTYMALSRVGNLERIIPRYINEILRLDEDLLEQTECELENEWVTRSEDDDDIPF